MWRFSKAHPTCNDGKGNINNIIDNTNYVHPINNINKDKRNKKSSKVNKDNNYNDSSNGEIKKNKFDLNEFNCDFPKKKDLHVEAMSCPDNYREWYDINWHSKQNKIGNQIYLKRKKVIYATSESSTVRILHTPHVDLNHLCVKSKSDKKGKCLISSCSTHYRNKILTYIYYKPI